jgi:2-polyprenyl-3-methyl-5-hydroxy-6-metoxy-1,4-benzoquinol methylase
MSDLPEHVRVNRDVWNVAAADDIAIAKRHWAAPEPSWGIWSVPEAEVGALPDVAGMDIVELGCGTAYFAAWLARRGARPIGINVSENQLATARAMQAEHGIEVPSSRRARRTCSCRTTAPTSP